MQEYKRYLFEFKSKKPAKEYAKWLDKETQGKNIPTDLCVKGERVSAIVHSDTNLMRDTIPEAEEITIQPIDKKRRFW